MQTPAPPGLLSAPQLRAAADGVLRHTREVIERFGPRPAGSEGERAALDYMRERLANACDGGVQQETFRFAPLAFMALPRVTSTIMLLAIAAYWWHGVAALLLSGLAVAAMVFELVLYKRFLDPFFPKGESQNVWGVRRPSGAVRRRIILNAHPDAAYEWRYNYHIPRWFPLVVLLSFGGLVMKLLIDALFVLLAGGAWSEGYTGVWLIVGVVQLVFLPTAVLGFFFTNFRHVSPGANDNLSGCFVATEFADALHAAGVRLQHTELMVCLTGAEEAGLRGAKAWTLAHRNALQGVETIFVALDTFRDLPHLKVYNRDMNGITPHDPAVCSLLRQAGADVGRDLPFATIPLGASDAAAATQGGLRAGCLAAMDPAPADYYHDRRDNADNMDHGCVAAVLEVVAAAVARYDAEGLACAEG